MAVAPENTASPAGAGTVAKVIVPLAVGAGVCVTLGLYGRLHEPTGIAVSIAGFSNPLTVKVWLTTGATVLAVVQLISALMMYGKLPAPAGPAVGTVHRWSGRIAFLLCVPVAVHCLYALGFGTYGGRELAHSLLGCVFFGAFTTKMLLLTRQGLAGWMLPLAGGLAFATLLGLWLSSALWFFTTSGVFL